MFMPRFPRHPSVPFDPDEGFIFLPPQHPAAPFGGLLDPIAPEPPVRGGLLDPVGWRDFREEERRRPARRIKQKDLPEILRDVPLGPEGGLIGYMLAEYVEPDGDRHDPTAAASGLDDPSGSPFSSFDGRLDPGLLRSPQPPMRRPGSETLSAGPHSPEDLGQEAILGPVDPANRVRASESARPLTADESQSLDAPARIEPRPDGSVWEIRGPVRTMLRPPDSVHGHYRTEPHYPPSTEKPSEDELRAFENKFQSLVAVGREIGYDFAADNLAHFLEGSGAPRFYEPNWLRSFPEVESAEQRVQQYIEEWMTGDRKPEAPEELVKDDLLQLQDGESFARSSSWDGDINQSPFGLLSSAASDLRPTADMFLAIGKSGVKATGDFEFFGEGDRIRFEGAVTHRWQDPYDWAKDGATWIPGWSALYGPLRYEEAVILQDHGGAKPFMMQSEWVRSVKGTLRKHDDHLTLESIEWPDRRRK